MKPKAIRRIVKHGRTIKPKPLPTPILAQKPPSIDPTIQLLMQQSRMQNELFKSVLENKNTKEEGGVVKIVQLLIVGIDPRTNFGKLMYAGLLVALIIWLVAQL